MVRTQTPASTNILPKSSQIPNEHLAMLSDEIHLAIAWDRPSILIAVHRSRVARERAMIALEKMLAECFVEQVKPDEESGILSGLVQRNTPQPTIFFIVGLGNQEKVYDELNLHREKII